MRQFVAERGQALIAVLGICAVALVLTLGAVAVVGAVSGKARLQRVADLAAVSGARSLRDDLPRLLSPPYLPGGAPNPAHLPRAAYLARARRAAREAAVRNGAAPKRLDVRIPDRRAPEPIRVRVAIAGELLVRGAPGVVAWALAEAAPPPPSWTGVERQAEGGGYSGPLAVRNGEGMRPDAAAAFDRLRGAAAAAGHALVVVSGYRSDEEQAALFAANPDPRWVAPPGSSLHRCATELDLGPGSAYGWLAVNAPRFGFEQRYSWEPWHYGFTAGPAPCSAAAESLASGGGAGDGRGTGFALPGYVPAPYREPIARAAARWNVSAALIAAQIRAESGFNPAAVSPAGALGIAQFMPATAASYGLSDPFDPAAAIGAQAQLMSDLLHRFGSVSLALAAYNAGPGAVEQCSCVPDYPETRAYVTRILAGLGANGASAPPPLEVRLIS